MNLRARLITLDKYQRHVADGKKESFAQSIERVIQHQRNLGAPEDELDLIRYYHLNGLASVAGRVRWLGGTDISRRNAISNFNCTFTSAKTISDIVDIFWCLLNGSGVGFKPLKGQLSGFFRHQEIHTIPSTRLTKGGNDFNREWTAGAVHTIQVGDSAEAWAKAVGKLLAYKGNTQRLVLDFSQIRPAGEVLGGYGWVSMGYKPLETAMVKIAEILNLRADNLLSAIDILDVVNLLGTTLSSRRSAQIALMDWEGREIEEFITAKADLAKTPWRTQSNNSVVFNTQPKKADIRKLLDMMLASGGSEPGIINGTALKARSNGYADGLNPCAEILLPDKGICNLVEINMAGFVERRDLARAVQVMAKANLRQSQVNLNDAILQPAWHENNEFLRLCGVGLTGVCQAKYSKEDILHLRAVATLSATVEADRLGIARPKNITTIKPSGTLSKTMGCSEGIHQPLGEYIFNNINFDRANPLFRALVEAGYHHFDNPYNPNAALVTLPVAYPGATGYAKETAIDQLERYKFFMQHYVNHNASVTISYEPKEIPRIASWLNSNWDGYVGVSFLIKQDTLKTAAELGYAYLPQKVVSKKEYDEYIKDLRDIDLSQFTIDDDIEDESCLTGACPVR